MTLVLELPLDLEKRLTITAHSKGLSLPNYALQKLETQRQENDNILVRIAGLYDYLDKIVEKGYLSPERALFARKAWSDFFRQVPWVFVPDMSVGSEQEVLFTWDREEHHLVMEILSCNTVEMFYHNRANDDYWDLDYQIGQPLQEDIQARIAVFKHHNE